MQPPGPAEQDQRRGHRREARATRREHRRSPAVRHPFLRATAGIHPHDAASYDDRIEARIERPKIDPDMPFVGRPVYTLAINMPNVTSYRGDWVIQFAEAIPEELRDHALFVAFAPVEEPKIAVAWPLARFDESRAVEVAGMIRQRIAEWKDSPQAR